MPGRPAPTSKLPVTKRRRKQVRIVDPDFVWPVELRRQLLSFVRDALYMGSVSGPPLPPRIADEDVTISDEDVEFLQQHKDYAGFLAKLDTRPMTRQVLGLKPDYDGDDLETNYEKGVMREKISAGELLADRFDALPVKTLAGELRYRSLATDVPESAQFEEAPIDGSQTTLEKKQKHKRRKGEKQQTEKLEEEKKQESYDSKQNYCPLTEEDDLDRLSKLKARMAELGVGLLADPSSNIMTLKEFQIMCMDRDEDVSQLAMLSSMAIFKDIIPGYRIRLPTEKESTMMVSKDIRRLWDYETALLHFYQAYIQLLVKNAKVRNMRWTALRCLCGLLEAVPHFNYRESILSSVIPRMGSDDDECSDMCCEAITSLLKNPEKHSNEGTVEAVQLIADYVKLHNCNVRPEVIQVFLYLSFEDDLLRESTSGSATQSSAGGHQQPKPKLSNRQEKKEKKAKKRELASQLRKEVQADFREAAAEPSLVAKRNLQMLTLSSIFETYFRILKTNLGPGRGLPASATTKASRQHPSISRPLLRPCLEGLAKFCHLINVDFMADLLKALQALADGGEGPSNMLAEHISVWERLLCCTVAFKLVRLNLDALRIDLRDFYNLFYNLLFETVSFRYGENGGDILAQALQVMLWEGGHSDMRRVAAFVKRLSTVALHHGSGKAVAVLATVRQLLVRHKKCRNMVENHPGPVTSNVIFPLGEEDPDLSDALSTVLWELTLFAQHCNPVAVKYASTIAKMNSCTSIVMPSATPKAVLEESSSFLPSFVAPSKSKHERRMNAKTQSLSPFVKSLQEIYEEPRHGKSVARQQLKLVQKSFAVHFRVTRACRQL